LVGSSQQVGLWTVVANENVVYVRSDVALLLLMLGVCHPYSQLRATNDNP
jgi:hypothetical protein